MIPSRDNVISGPTNKSLKNLTRLVMNNYCAFGLGYACTICQVGVFCKLLGVGEGSSGGKYVSKDLF